MSNDKPTPKKAKSKVSNRIERSHEEHFECSHCKIPKASTDYDKTQLKRVRKGNQGWCRRCLKEKGVQSRYGISIDEYENLMKDQDHKCAICETKLDGDKNTHLDHNYSTGGYQRIFVCWMQ